MILLRELSRTEEDLQQSTVRVGHQLRELLIRYYPQMLRLCPGFDEPWFSELLERAPQRAKGDAYSLHGTRLLHLPRIRPVSAEQVLMGRRLPALQLAPGAMEATSEHALLQLPLLRLLRQQRKEIASRIQGVLQTMGEAEGILRSIRLDYHPVLTGSGASGRRHDACGSIARDAT